MASWTTVTPLPAFASYNPTYDGQVTQAWQKVQTTTLNQAGTSLSDIVSVRQWLTSAEDVRAYVEVRSKFITQKPAFMLG